MVHPQKIFGRLGNSLFQYAYIYAQMKRGVLTDIYVQNPVYFEDYKDEIKMLFKGKNKPVDRVAVHVRRGGNPINKDEPKYVDNPFYVNLSETDYYEKAMALFPGEKFMIFSDDIEWCKKQDLFKGCAFSEGHDELKDLEIMSSCKGVITANSSYSWWGAYLSDGKVVAPKVWYRDGVERTKCPKEWTRV